MSEDLVFDAVAAPAREVAGNNSELKEVLSKIARVEQEITSLDKQIKDMDSQLEQQGVGLLKRLDLLKPHNERLNKLQDEKIILLRQQQQQSAPANDVLSALKALKLEVHQVKESLPISHLMKPLTPTQASLNKGMTGKFLERLGLNVDPIQDKLKDGSVISYTHDFGDAARWKFNFSWGDLKSAETTASAAVATEPDVIDDTLSPLPTDSTRSDKALETKSYPLVQKFLQDIGQVAYVVGNGQHLSNGCLFNKEIWTNRERDPSTRGQKVNFIQVVHGRTDLVVLTRDYISEDGHTIISLDMVKVLIEIKTGKNVSQTGSIHEAMVQLIGANAENRSRSPPVVLSNLKQTHYVLYLTRESDEYRPHYYVIRKKNCKSFPDAIHFALELASMKCHSQDFARPGTPEDEE